MAARNDKPGGLSFEFATSARIVFGEGRLSEIGAIAASLAEQHRLGAPRVFIVAGSHAVAEGGPVASIIGTLESKGVTVAGMWHGTGEPTVSSVSGALKAARDARAEIIVAIGGGSALDTGKAVAGLTKNEGDLVDYLEGVGKGLLVTGDVLPMIAVPTTAGTGTEVTKNAVITADDGSFKKSMRSSLLIPDVALVDPLLMLSSPPAVTASSGLDALTQLLEAYTSEGSGPVTDALAVTGIERAASSLVRAFEDGTCISARSDMALASLLGGVCLANAGLGAVHGIVAPLGAMHGVPHGAGCAALLPHVVAANVGRCRTEKQDVAAKYTRVARMLASDESVDAEDLPKLLGDLVAKLQIPRLAEWGAHESGIPAVVAKSRGSSMRFNPVELSDEEIAGIILAAL